MLSRYHAIAWGIPFFLFLLPLFSKSYGYEYGACWILSTAPVLRFVQFYIPLWIVIGYNVWNISTLIFHLRGLVLSTQDDSQANTDLQVFWRLALYPVILIICWFFGTINRIYNSLHPDEPIFALYFLHKFFGSMQGFFNFLVYGMSTAVRAKLYEVLSWTLSLVGIKLRGANSEEMELTKYSISREEGES
ncbi:hypothetical protein GUITHDRAFT_99314 [Guillardia theta CCMP2712]|uniref:G-protein coupled receptors family 2 profile 2 domain-containing protein n=1 Tax=Guillardia theta (strain CCMP2712) TaxID=905079 RepID=L1K590_GUITC|nr:hypothetical protein GUITHDRAFT_99314 [Guillardia theta CCMP2712]EKX55538.1 hypothetical protein GUITHDRAFT_99314 [Guillardia theta CCMP2712]|eukprot:XP_005842518.1 hypothetical protein GUITHDRAFT_99314 [Guillardia theta CCMP2712]